MADTKQPSYWLVVGKRRIELTPGAHTIGRDPNAGLSFPDDLKLSRNHARITVKPNGVEVEDLGSTNGTWIDDALVTGSSELPLGARINFGNQAGELHYGDRPRIEQMDTAPQSAVASAPTEDTTSTHNSPPLNNLRGTVLHALDKGRIDDAQKMLDSALGVLQLSIRRIAPDSLELLSDLALRVAAASGEGHYAESVADMHLQRGILPTEEVLDRIEAIADDGPEFDCERVEQRLTALVQRHVNVPSTQAVRDRAAALARKLASKPR